MTPLVFFRRTALCLWAVLIFFGPEGAVLPAGGADSASVPLEIAIPEANIVKVKGAPLSLTIPIALDSRAKSFSFIVTATGDRQRVLTARLSAPLLEGLTFTLEVAAPGVGRGLGPKVLGTGESDLLAGLCCLWGREFRGVLTIRADNSLSRSSGMTEVILSLK